MQPFRLERRQGLNRSLGVGNQRVWLSNRKHQGDIPSGQHSRKYTNRKGVTHSIGTIDDVVRWSKTLRGGVQSGFDFMFQDDDDGAMCMSGYCE